MSFLKVREDGLFFGRYSHEIIPPGRYVFFHGEDWIVMIKAKENQYPSLKLTQWFKGMRLISKELPRKVKRGEYEIKKVRKDWYKLGLIE